MGDSGCLVMDFLGFKYISPGIIRMLGPLLVSIVPCSVFALCTKLGILSGKAEVKKLLRAIAILLAPFLVVAIFVIWKTAGFDPANDIDRILSIVGSMVMIPFGMFAGYMIVVAASENSKTRVRGSAVYRKFVKMTDENPPALVICCHDGIRMFWGNLTLKPKDGRIKSVTDIEKWPPPTHYDSYKDFYYIAERIEDIDFDKNGYNNMYWDLAEALIELFCERHKNDYIMKSLVSITYKGVMTSEGPKYYARNGVPQNTEILNFYYFAYSKSVYKEETGNSQVPVQVAPPKKAW